MAMRFRLVGWEIPLDSPRPRRDISALAAAVQYGASGVVATSAGIDELIQSIRLAGTGGSLLSQPELRDVLSVLDLSRGADASTGRS